MNGHYIFLVTLILTFHFPTIAQAENDSSISTYMSSNDDNTPLDETIWKLRITNHMVIGKQKSMADFALWCKTESEKENTNHKPCEIFAKEGVSTEGALIDAIPVTKAIITRLNSMPKNNINKDHIRAFKEQLEEMEKIPTPLHDIADKTLKRLED